MIKMRQLLIALLGLISAQQALPHSLLLSAPRVAGDLTFMSPKPRDMVDGNKLPGSLIPCGNNTVSAVAPTYVMGQQVKVEWAETIQHPGYFVFQISSDNGVTWADLAEYIDDQNLADINRADPATWHYYPTAANANFRITLPAGLTCANCIIRFIQHMSDVKMAHANNPLHAGIDYFSCADIKIANAAGQVPPPVVPPVVPPPVVPPGDPGQSAQSSTAANDKLPSLNSCGFIASDSNGGGPTTGLYISLVMSLLFFPILLITSLRLQRITRRRR